MAGMWKRLSVFDKIWLGLTAAVLLGLLWVGIPHFRSASLLNKGVSALAAEGDAQAAIYHLESAVQVEPGNTQAHRWLAKAYLHTGDLDRALAAADSALSLAPDNPLAELELGDVYDRLGDAEGAIAFYEAGWVGDRVPQLRVNYLKLADESWMAVTGSVPTTSGGTRCWGTAMPISTPPGVCFSAMPTTRKTGTSIASN